MSEKIIEPPVCWTIEVVPDGPKRGRVRLRLWHGEYPPQPDATLIVALEFPGHDAGKIGKDLVDVSNWDKKT